MLRDSIFHLLISIVKLLFWRLELFDFISFSSSNFLFNSDILCSILLVGGGVGSNLSIAECKTLENLEIDSSILTNSLFNFLILFLRWDLNFCAPSILFIMESLSDLNLSSSLSEDLICLFNLFALFLLFICLALSGLGVGGDKVGGGGGGLVGFGGLVRVAGAGGVSKVIINSAFLNLEYPLCPSRFAIAFN